MTAPLSNSGFERVGINLQRYVPSGVIYARFKVNGEIIMRSLKTTAPTTAKLRLGVLMKDELAKGFARKRAGMTKDGSITVRGAADLFLKAAQDDVAALKIKKRTYETYLENLKAIEKTWPELMAKDVKDLTHNQCQAWAKKLRLYGTQHRNNGAKKARTGISAPRFNGCIYLLRNLFKIALEQDHIYQNPVKGIEMMSVRKKHLLLPSKAEFKAIVVAIKTAKGRFSRACADMVAFLAYSGCRISEARRVLFGHIDWDRGTLSVHGDPVTGTKNWEVRTIPMIDALRDLLETIKRDRDDERISGKTPVLCVKTAQAALKRACGIIGVTRMTHHDLRHLFATSCIESGVDIPTVSRWLGHKDGGALAMRTYGHLRVEHSTEAAKKVKF
jgi:integrase